MTAKELIERAAQCKTCGKAHEYRKIGSTERSWRDPKNGHNYAPALRPAVIEQLKALMS